METKSAKDELLQEVLDDNVFLRDENSRLDREMTEYYFTNIAKANLLDVIIFEGYITQNTLNKCIAKLDEIDRQMLGENQDDRIS